MFFQFDRGVLNVGRGFNVGLRGPLPDPQRQKRNGNPARFPAEVVADPKLPARAPAGLGKVGRAVWRDLRDLEWAQISDGKALQRLAELEDERALLTDALNEHGPVLSKPVMTARGDVVGSELYSNPAIRELRRLDVQILELLKGFGLTPMSRARLGLAVVAAKKDNTLTQLIMRKYRMDAGYDLSAGVIEIADD